MGIQARAIDAKSPWTSGHAERVTDLALSIGQTMGLNDANLQSLHRAGLLHDIGKIGIPAVILDKPGKLTDEEYKIVQKHPHTGARILHPIHAFAEVTPIVLEHHEWFNGKGYPNGLSGEEICLGARIIAVADVFEALTADRPYRPGWGLERAVEFIRKHSGSQFDPKVAEVFLEIMAKGYRHLETRRRHLSSTEPETCVHFVAQS